MRRAQEKVQRQVSELIRKNGVTRPPVPVESIAENLGIEIRFEAAEDDLSGALIRKPKEVVIGVNSAHHPNRQRFTIAHEIGHFILHKGNKAPRRRRFSRQPARRVRQLGGDRGKRVCSRAANADRICYARHEEIRTYRPANHSETRQKVPSQPQGNGNKAYQPWPRTAPITEAQPPPHILPRR